MRCGISSSRKENSAASVQLQALQLFAAGGAGLDVGFHLDAAAGIGQLLEEVIPQIEWRATHDTPRAFMGASSALSSSSAV